ncbi:MAG TPA: RsmG family class I SAM-dependent methyltransferase [Actinomycetota bacterium]|nr:RsmG family class I SAM-dependent methyltransferase [Actinomycetota bacterium]
MFPVKPEDDLAAYARLLRWWAPRADLVASGDLARLESRHIDDSLKARYIVASLPEGAALDAGSGAGFPGVPLAIVEPGRWWRLLEPRAKRAAFLDEVVRELDLNAEVVRRTTQQAASDPSLSGAHAVVTARALAPPTVAFELIAPLVAPDGLRIVWVGSDSEIPSDAEELQGGLAIIGHRGPEPGP